MRTLTSFGDALLRGAGQVFLQNSPLTGLLFLIAIAWAAVAAHDPTVVAGGVLGLVIGTATAVALRAPIHDGLYGFNALLTGLALPTFLGHGSHLWIYLIFGSAATTVTALALGKVLKEWDVPPLTSPFVVTSMLLLMAAYQFHRIGPIALGPATLPHPITAARAAFDFTPWSTTRAVLRGVAQVMLLDNWISGLLIVLGLAVSSLWAAAFALAGSVVATLAAIWLGADATSIDEGLFGFSAVLTAIAIGVTFYATRLRTAVYALLAAAFAVVVQAALDTVLLPAGVPTLTAPFVLTTWLVLIPKREPHPQVTHTHLDDRLMGDAPPRSTPP
ncbi:urea transporter [Dactylosporangium sp. CA-139066]|uniref:urea transporter n=1 Tax=Dactylosporangium sp. CA-139066 TaxID=3239930 RepID=UPI003D8EEC1B